MFKIESYITPLLMGYVDQYVKLQKEDFQLSLWGGDVVLNNLELRLDFFEKLLQIPVTFKSGRIHELRIHVPWSRLGSEPVVITINTIECILKVRDTAYDDTSSTHSGDVARKQLAAARGKPKLKKQDTEDLPPGYIQGIVNRVINNVAIVINNLIVKFVEDDIVLSLNIKSAECYAVDLNWNRAFVDFVPPELMLRKIIKFCDLTICLDKTDTSGKIVNYQEPLVYKSSVSCRILLTYDSINAKIPNLTRFNLFCEELNLTLNDNQLPMVIRLVNMCIALYFGVTKIPDTEENSEPDKQEVSRNNPDESSSGESNLETEDQGWGGWAMSFIFSEQEEGIESSGLVGVKPVKPIVAIGFYINKASLLFKLTEKQKESSSHTSGQSRLLFNPFLYVEIEGMTAEVLVQALTFVDAQCGITSFNVRTEGPCSCGEKDSNDKRSLTMLTAGEQLANKTASNYLSDSLFDPNSPECQGRSGVYYTTNESHLAMVTETYGVKRYGAFWFDYMYSWEKDERKNSVSGSKSSLTSDSSEAVFQRENAVLRFVFDKVHANITSTFIHRVEKIIYCANNHQYIAYATPLYVEEDGDRSQLSDDQIQSLEDFIPTRSYHVTFIQPIIVALIPEHDKWDSSKRSNKMLRKNKDAKSTQEETKNYSLPAVRVSASRLDFQMSTPMYPKKLVHLISNIAGPSSNLLYHCHSHTQFKVLDCHGGLQKIDAEGNCSHLHTVVSPCNTVIYYRSLIHPKLWTSSSLPIIEAMYEIPQFSVSLTKASLLLLVRMASSWIRMIPDINRYTDDSLLDDIFQESDVFKSSMPVIDLAINGLEIKTCQTSLVTAYTGNLTSLQLLLYSKESQGETKVMPIMYGPSNTQGLEKVDSLVRQNLHIEDINTDCLAFTTQIPLKTDISEAPAVMLFGMEGIAVFVDPKLKSWFNYAPRVLPSATKQKEVVVDLALAHAASPLQNISQVSLHSSSSVTQPTSSRPKTQSQSQMMSPNTLSAVGPDKDDLKPENKSWFVVWYPLFRMLNVQVEIKSSVVYFTNETIHLNEPSMDISTNLNTAILNGSLNQLAVLYLPSVTIHSSDLKIISVLQEVPIQTLDGSLVGDKLPWTVKLSNLTMYSIHDKTCLPIFKPLDIKSTVAVSCKYSPPASQNISTLGLNLLIDLQPLTLAISQKQILLGLSIFQQLSSLVRSSTQLVNFCLKSLIVEKKPNIVTCRSSPVEKVESGLSCDEEAGQETSEEASQMESPVHESSDSDSKDGTQLTMWTMLVLPKVTLKLYSLDDCVKIVLDDLSTSIDIQQVYSKIKLNLAGFNINNFLQSKEDKEWKKGSCEGIVFSCLNEISHDVHIVSNKFWNNESHISAAKSFFPSQDAVQRDQPQGFLFLTFTRALCKNTTKRMKKRSMDIIPGLMDTDTVTGQCDLYFHKYISEICLKIEPCDVIIYPPVIESLLTIFDSGFTNRDVPLPSKKLPNVYEADIPIFTTHNIPLLYINSSNVRLFLPRNDKRDNSDSDTHSTLDHDVIVIQLNAVDIKPQADNPLPRYPMKKELYHRAIASGLTQIPGASIEDRQYQIDVKGLSISTGCCADFMKSIKTEVKGHPDFPSVQMPALEWNTVLSLQQKEKDDIKLIPITLPFDLRVVAAPAIVYQRLEADTLLQQILVCGFSMEVNVTSDLDLYISTNQIHLLNKIMLDLIYIAQSPVKTQKSTTGVKHSRQSDNMFDSGIDSDMSTITITNERQPYKFPSHAAPSVTSDIDLKTKIMPFDLLLTAGRISCTLYSHQTLKEDFHPQSKPTEEKKTPPKTKQNSQNWKQDNFGNLPSNGSDEGEVNSEYLHPSDSSTNFGFLKVHRDSSGSVQDILAGTVCIRPFVYMYIAQPHTILSINSTRQKFEMSCYDIIVRGSESELLIPVSDVQIIPDCSNFSLYWIETRAGQPNQKTGIPPSLFTVQVKDFLHEPACIMLKFERPLKGHIDLHKVQQLQDFIGEITLSAFGMTNEKCEQTSSQTDPSTPGILSKIHHIEIVTDQVMVAMETIPNSGGASCTLSTSSIRVNTEFAHSIKGELESITGRFHIKDLFLSTHYNSNILPFIGPTSLHLETIFHWTEHSGKIGTPKIIVALETGLITVKFGQEHYLCFEAILKNVTKYFDIKDNSGLLKKEELVKEDKNIDDGFISDASNDDFKSGRLEYIFGPEGNDIQPNPGEIIFNKNLSDGYSCMSWCYHQSRVLRHADISPLPFSMEDNTTVQLQIDCVLQYWDTATRQFIDYIHFHLSETDTSSLDLPKVTPSNSRDLITSQMWRVIISHLSNSETVDPVIQPTSLAACMKLDSCFVPDLIPVYQMCCVLTAIDLHLLNHLQYTSKEVPDKLKPFYFSPCEINEQEFAIIRLGNFCATVNHIEGKRRRSSVQTQCSVSLDMIEYGNMTMMPVLHPVSTQSDISIYHNDKPAIYDISLKGEKMKVAIGKSTIQTLNTTIQAWLPTIQKTESPACPVYSQYIICNDTQQPLRFGQVGTEENNTIQPREMIQYSWRSHKLKQILHMCVDCSIWKWCDPFDITTPGNIVRSIRSKDQNFTIIIKIKQISNIHTQITFTGQLVMCNRLSQNVEVKLVTSARDSTVNETTAMIGSRETMPSCIVEHSDIREIKLRLPGLKSPWSQEIHVTGDKMKMNKLVKIPLADKSSYIHLWCRIFCQHFTNAVQNLVMLTPLYVLRTHLPRPLFVAMDSPKLNQQQELEVAGQGREYQLHCVGGDINHALAFKLGRDMEKSNPPLVISTGLIDQIQQSTVEKVDIEELCKPVPQNPAVSWPYLNSSSGGQPTHMTSTCQDDDSDIPQPSVELNVRLSEYLPGCKTLLVDIATESLVTNISSIDLVIIANQQNWTLNHGKTFTLPKLKDDQFELGYQHGEGLLKSPAIPISSDEIATKLYSTDIGRVLFIDGVVHSTISLPGQHNQLLFLMVKSELYNGIRIITIREDYSFNNLTDIPLTTELITLPLGSSKTNIPDSLVTQENIPAQKAFPNSSLEYQKPLLFWSLLSTHDIRPQQDNFTQYIHYLILKQDSSQSANTDQTTNDCHNNLQWSIPIRIAANTEGMRHTVSIPQIADGEFYSRPYCLSAQTKNGVTHLTLMEDHSSICVLHNNCPFPVYYGQTLMNITLSGMTIQEEAELLDKLPMIPPGGKAHYTMPHLNSVFPLTDSIKYPRIHFSSVSRQNEIQLSPWSSGVDLMAGNTFVKFPQIADVKVEVELKSSIYEVILEPVGKAEISAREIRSRLKGTNQEVKRKESGKPEIENEANLEHTPFAKRKAKVKQNTTDISIGCYLGQFSLVILDESSSVESIGEVLHLNMERVFVASYPVALQTHKSSLSVCIGNIQLDNQAYGTGQFDFPVLLLPQEKTHPLLSLHDFENLSVIERYAILKSSSFLNCQIVMATNCLDQSVIHTFDIAVRPVSLYIDDAFIYRFLKELELLLPTSLSAKQTKTEQCGALYNDIRQTALCFSQPIRIQSLTVQPIKMLLSVHASIKLFLAADQSPLSFGRFERHNVCTTNYQLLRAVAMHYASGAIFRAGIVIGSLEILGNPTGLVRSFSIGISDLFRMPYTGLTSGPGAFVSGISSGMASLLRNVSAGMITSVTNLASSVSRNMDRLSMDSNHLERQEENRRNRPIGVSDGLKQGLTGFGLSLLGAVAGLADQPLQNIISNQGRGERPSSTSAVASGIVTGMGKGLVGIVTKPIGGAAELVSQTGQGILHGTGLGQHPERLEKPRSRSKSIFSNAIIKYPMKIFSTLPTTPFLLSMEACHLDLMGSEVIVTLILTSEIVFVLNNEEDGQQQAFSIRELECFGKVEDPSLISMIWTDNFFRTHSEPDHSNSDRVAAFVDSAATFGLPANEDGPGTDNSQSDNTPAGGSVAAPQYDFHVNPEYRDSFIALFNIIKNKIMARGFPLL